MPPRMPSNRGSTFVPTRSSGTGTSSLPDDAFDTPAYTRELRQDRRDMSSVYEDMYSDGMDAMMRKMHAKQRKTQAGPVHCKGM